jgi:hypothetical protein
MASTGHPPPIPEWQTEREKKNKFLHWLRSNGFLVVAKDGSPGDGKHYKANVDVLMAIDAVELSVEMRPEVCCAAGDRTARRDGLRSLGSRDQQEAVIITLSLLQPPLSSFGLQRFSPTHF